MEQYSLTELNNYINKVIKANFFDSVWVQCEISQISSSRGHVYLELVEKDENAAGLTAKASGVIWATTYKTLIGKLGENASGILKQGSKVLFAVKIEYHPVFGLKLIIHDIDLSFTLGKLEEQRLQTIQRLKDLQLFGKNALLPLVSIPQRIAIISSPTAAGYIDFIKQLEGNPYGFDIQHRLFPAAMQGERTSVEVVNQLLAIEQIKAHYDAIVIIRGGGSKIDLSDFDAFEICEAVAKSSLPVLTGIGHEIDESITDLVAHTALKTPTAVAEFIIGKFLRYLATLQDFETAIKQFAAHRLKSSKHQMELMYHQLSSISFQKIEKSKRALDNYERSIAHIAQLIIKNGFFSLEKMALEIQQADPSFLMSKGYSITFNQKGQVVKSVLQLQNNEPVTIQYLDGKTTAIIQNIINNE